MRAQTLATCIVNQVTDLEAVYNLRVSLGLNFDATDAQVATKLTTEISTTTCLNPATNQPAATAFQASQAACVAEKFCSHNGDGSGPSSPSVTDATCQNDLFASGGNFCSLPMPFGLGYFNLQKATSAACPIGVCFSNPSIATEAACTSGSFCTTSTSAADATACAATGYCRGNWPLTTQANCESEKYCNGEIGIVREDMTSTECTKCGGTMMNKYTWVPGTMAPGIWAAISWKQTTAVQKYVYGTFLDFDKFGQWINKIMARFLADVFKSALGCMLYPLLRGLQETSHACTADGKAMYPSAPRDVKFNVAKALFYRGLIKRASAGPGTSITIAKDGVTSANGQCSVDMDIATGGDVGSATGRHLLQSGGNVYNKAGSSVVGQTVGNGVSVTLTGSATYRLCLEVDPTASTPGRTTPSIAMSDSNGKILNQEMKTDVEGGKYCGSFTSAGTYYPVRTGTNGGSAASFVMPSFLVILFLALFML
jgi:hypothetical protein